MADNNGFAAIQAAVAKKRNAGGAVAQKIASGGPKTPGSGNNNNAPKQDAIARRLASKGSSKSQPAKPPAPGDNGTNQESGY